MKTLWFYLRQILIISFFSHSFHGALLGSPSSLDFPRIPSTWNQGTQTGTEKAQAVTIRFNEVDAFQALHGA